MTGGAPTRVAPSPAAYALIDELLALYLRARGPHVRSMMASLVDQALHEAAVQERAHAEAAEARLRELQAPPVVWR